MTRLDTTKTTRFWHSRVNCRLRWSFFRPTKFPISLWHVVDHLVQYYDACTYTKWHRWDLMVLHISTRAQIELHIDRMQQVAYAIQGLQHITFMLVDQSLVYVITVQSVLVSITRLVKDAAHLQKSALVKAVLWSLQDNFRSKICGT